MLTQLNMVRSWLACKLGVVRDEEVGGGEIIAVVVVIAIVIVLGILFQDNITALFDSLWGNVTGNAGQIGK